jgi:hypothetical protein
VRPLILVPTGFFYFQDQLGKYFFYGAVLIVLSSFFSWKSFSFERKKNLSS